MSPDAFVFNGEPAVPPIVTLPVVETVLASIDVVAKLVALTVLAVTVRVLTEVEMLALSATTLPTAKTVCPRTSADETIFPPVILAIAIKFPLVEILAVAVKLLSVPTLVMLGCAFVVTVAAVFAKTALEILPTKVPMRFPPVTLPDTDKEFPVSLPVNAKLPLVTLPVTSKLDPEIPPLTVRLLKVPTLVILG